MGNWSHWQVSKLDHQCFLSQVLLWQFEQHFHDMATRWNNKHLKGYCISSCSTCEERSIIYEKTCQHILLLPLFNQSGFIWKQKIVRKLSFEGHILLDMTCVMKNTSQGPLVPWTQIFYLKSLPDTYKQWVRIPRAVVSLMFTEQGTNVRIQSLMHWNVLCVSEASWDVQDAEPSQFEKTHSYEN